MLKRLSEWFKNKGQELQAQAYADKSILRKRQEPQELDDGPTLRKRQEPGDLDDGPVRPTAERTPTEPDQRQSKGDRLASILNVGWQRRFVLAVVWGALAMLLVTIIRSAI